MGLVAGNLSSGFDKFRSLVCFTVKNGFKVLFWTDVWSSDQPFKVQFPNLSRLFCLKEKTVNQEVKRLLGIARKPLENDFLEKLRCGEEGLLSLLTMLANTKVAFESDNETLGPHDRSGQFAINSYCIEMYAGLKPT